jgi:dUTP pyrophosphatase
MLTWRIKKLVPEAVLPAKKNPDDAGWDIVTIESATLAPGERRAFLTGLASEFPSDYVAVIKDRSSLGSRGLHTLAGVIDSSYRGEWKIIVLNTSDEPVHITAGDRIAQCLIVPVPEVQLLEVEELTDSARGIGGFGSTGK